eukprot:IDg2767t1
MTLKAGVKIWLLAIWDRISVEAGKIAVSGLYRGSGNVCRAGCIA